MQNIWNNHALVDVLKNNGVAVMPTDTLYGIVGRAESETTVARIYELRKRNPEKPCIILISDIKEVEKFSVNLSSEQKEKIKEFWSFDNSQDLRPTSIILDCENEDLWYLHRGTKTLAFRMPANVELRELISKTGPLIAPSANLEGQPPAKNVEEAKNYFRGGVDIYINGGELTGAPSKVIRLVPTGEVSIVRS